MSTTHIVSSGQDIFDVVLQQYGTLDNLNQFLTENNLGIDDSLSSGQELIINKESTGNLRVKTSFENTKFVVMNVDESQLASTVPAWVNTYSLDFDGVDERILFASAVDLGTTSSESIWIKQSTPATSENIIGIPIPANLYHLHLGTDGTAYVRIGYYYWEFNSAATQTAINTTDWIHIAIIRTGVTTCRFYVNGVDNDGIQTNASMVGNTLVASLGNAFSGGYPYEGLIDEYGCWNTALSASEVTAIYNSGVPTDLSAESGLIGLWRMGDGATFVDSAAITAWTIPDESTNSNAGTSINMEEADRSTDVPT